MKHVPVVLVTGSRHWTDQNAVWAALQEEIGNELVAIVRHGACPTGADAMADAWCGTQPGIAVDRIPAAWDLMGKMAGPSRNTQMVNLGADICLAFPLKGSRGTIDCMTKAYRAGIRVINRGENVSYR